MAVVAGVALVLPAGLGRPRLWVPIAAAVLAACVGEAGSVPSVALASTWVVAAAAVVVITAAGAARAVRTARRSGLGWRPVVEPALLLVVSMYALTAAVWFTASRAAIEPVGIGEPIVELTAVHFTYVGVGAVTVAAAAARRAPSDRGRRVGVLGTLLCIGAPLVVAAGFTTGLAVAQIGGAVALSLGVFAVAALELVAAARRGSPWTRLTLAISGLAVWAPMVLAVMWAAGQHLDVPALDIDAMVRTHGAANALGFVGAGLLALTLERRDAARSHPSPTTEPPMMVGRT